jgi:hypothetical protein
MRAQAHNENATMPNPSQSRFQDQAFSAAASIPAPCVMIEFLPNEPRTLPAFNPRRERGENKSNAFLPNEPKDLLKTKQLPSSAPFFRFNRAREREQNSKKHFCQTNPRSPLPFLPNEPNNPLKTKQPAPSQHILQARQPPQHEPHQRAATPARQRDVNYCALTQPSRRVSLGAQALTPTGAPR